MKDIIIKAEDVYFSYDDENSYSLNGLSLEIERGKKVAVMGSNGAGKSTFFLTLNGINRILSGKIFVDGKEIGYSRKELLELRSKVGIVFQDPDNQLFSASVKQEISFGALNMGMSEEEADKAVEEIIELLEITPFKEKPTHALSGGQKKQVSIADVLVMNPQIVILDEPASALDPKHTEIVNGIINLMVERGITVLISTHDVNYAYSWADEVLVFHEGKVIRHDVPIVIFSDLELLKMTNLKQPVVLEMLTSLKNKGIINETVETPKTLAELEKIIQEL